jgi:hypothetical protein
MPGKLKRLHFGTCRASYNHIFKRQCMLIKVPKWMDLRQTALFGTAPKSSIAGCQSGSLPAKTPNYM